MEAKMSTKPSEELKTFPNPYPNRNYTISLECPEFTCLCPMTGQPDFACLYISYIPDKICLELKAIKLYLWNYRNQGAFHEAVTNKILEDFLKACSPRQMTIQADFRIRGGIHTRVTVSYPDDKTISRVRASSVVEVPAEVSLLQPVGDASKLEKISTTHEIGYRPWGNYEVLSESVNYKIKKITLVPGKRLSLQRHHRRSETWVITQGLALAILGNEERKLGPGDILEIPVGTVHRVQNCGDIPLVLTEVQRGEYLGEDDIERLGDDFGRV
jgi:7-cyano-7-deazaguanine reductase